MINSDDRWLNDYITDADVDVSRVEDLYRALKNKLRRETEGWKSDHSLSDYAVSSIQLSVAVELFGPVSRYVEQLERENQKMRDQITNAVASYGDTA